MTEQPDRKDTSGEELTRGTLGSQQSIRMNLSASQLHDHENEPSWKAPRQKPQRWSTTRLITVVVVAAVVLLILLRVAGII